MAPRRFEGVPAAFAGLSGVALALWWAATLLGALPTSFEPVQRQPSHIAAELALAAALLLGAWLDLHGAPRGKHVLCAALGALAYASTNVLGEFAHSLLMSGLLVATVLLSLLALIVAAVGTTRPGGRT